MQTHSATKVTRCRRCDRVIHKRQKIVKAFDLGFFVHVGCMRELPPVDLDTEGLAAGFTVGITGSRRAVTPQQERLMRRWFGGVRADAFVTGACRGVDGTAGRVLVAEHPQAHHVVVVPANRNAVKEWWPRLEGIRKLEVFEMPDDTDYRDRNEVIVELADHLVAFVEHSEDDPRSTRSGTWQTVRLAREAGVPVTLMDLARPTEWTHTPYPYPRGKPADGLF